MIGLIILRVVGWVAYRSLQYLLVCLVGWVVWILLLAGATGTLPGPGAIGLLLSLLALVSYYFGLPTVLVLGVLGVVGLLGSARAFRVAALVGLPLVAAVPVGDAPSVEYGAQLLFQLPIQVAFALLVRHPLPERDGDARLLAAWGLTEPTELPDRVRDEPPAGPPRWWWYGGLAGALAWLTLLLTGGRPLLQELLPLGQPAGPVDLAILSLPLLGTGSAAWACRLARRRRAASKPVPSGRR